MAQKKYKPKPFPFSVLTDEQSVAFCELLERERMLRVPGLGDFSLKDIEERVGWNPILKKAMNVPAYTRICFSVDPRLSRHFNDKTNVNSKEKTQEVDGEEETGLH